MTRAARSELRDLSIAPRSAAGGSALRALAEGVLVGSGFGLLAVAAKVPLVLRAGDDLGYVLYVAAIGLASWFRGLSGGVVATLLTGFLNTFLFVHPGELLLEETAEQIRFVAYLASGFVVAGLFRSLRVERDALADSLAQQARLAREIADRDERLELVLAASQTGVWEHDLATGVTTWSDQVYEQAGRTRAAAPVPFEAIVAPEDAERLRIVVRAALDGRRPFDADVRLALAAERWIHVRGRAFYDGDRPVRIVGTSEEITERILVERRRAELAAAEERAAEFQRAFIDVLSHELRTPMTTIYAAAEMLRRPRSSLSEADRTGLLADIHDETRRLDGLIENLLVLSRAERAPIEAVAEAVDLRRAIEAALRVEADRRPTVRFEADLPDELPLVAGSDAYVRRVLANLLSNAGKYVRPDGHVVVTAGRDGDEVEVRVLDDGVGLDGDPGRLFELFYRSPAAARHAAGSGIGLYVSARLVDAMRGRIWGRPRPEGGAEFGFALRGLEAPVGEDRDPEATDADGIVGGAAGSRDT